MLTDPYGQNIPFPSLSDKPNARTLAEGIVNGLTPRGVMRYASRSVRGANIPNPVAGMATWIIDVAVLEVYDGTQWAVVAAGSSQWKPLTLRSGYAHNGNGAGTAAYRIVNLFGDRTIMFRGGIAIDYGSGDTAPGDGWFATLPTADCPDHLTPVTVACSVAGASQRTSVKLDVNPASGQNANQLKFIGVNGSDAKPIWVSLHGTYCSLGGAV
ncbi:hypothetical protein [Streptomyces sp. NPDC007063]|uniref:hypothetical protein n=1 Tax=Streptomyces sp. NPDC007063 TaxID=3364772 RepID=UPI0036B5D099